MTSKHLFIIMTVLCFPLFLAAGGAEEQQVGAVSEQDLEMVELQKEQMRMQLEGQKARLEMEQTEAMRAHQLTWYFGYRYFSGGGVEPTFLENLPVPRTYRLGPGDEIAVSLWGQTQMQSSYVIDRRGMIFVPEIGPLLLTGKSVDEAEVYLKSEFAKVYATLKSTKDRTYMDVAIGALQSINIQIVGEVVSPGIYTVHPFSTVMTALLQAGGVDMTGSLRDVQVRRGGDVAMQVDLYDLMLEGRQSGDFRLQEGDIIFVPVRKSTVEISGEVYRPGIYEMIAGESVEQLISYAGGLKPTGGSTVELRRIIERGKRESDDDAVIVSYLDVESLNPHEVLDGDDFWVKNIMEVSRQVYVSGQVKRPGSYAFTDSLRLLDLLEMAGGIYDEDYLKSVNLGKLDITRRDIDSDYSEIITLELAEVISGNGHDNILLNNHDQVTVYPNQRYLPAKTVTISGEVLLPGVYPIQRDFETLGSIIKRAGGYTSRAFEEGIILMRGDTRLVIEGLENTVADGDVVSVPEKTDVVEVAGAVYNPGLVSYKKGRTVNQYIRLAGGMTPDAIKSDIIVMYADGSVKLKRYFLSPGIRSGATIQVNPQSAATPIEMLFGFLTDLTNNLTSVLASYLLVTQIATIFTGG